MVANPEPPRLRWAVNVGAWSPGPEEYAFLLSRIPASERAACERFRQAADRRRALVSRLLQVACAARVLGVAHEEVDLARTKGGKPYLVAGWPRPTGAPNFNYSVSHEGDYVVLASENLLVVGVDVAAPPEQRREARRTAAEMLAVFSRQLSEGERAWLGGLAGEEAKEGGFRALWALKEATVKAMGLGLAYDLAKCAFTFPEEAGSLAGSGRHGFPLRPGNVAEAHCELDGAPASSWRFHVHALPGGHVAAVARAPPEAAVDALGGFLSTLSDPRPAGSHRAHALAQPEPPFAMLGVSDLLPPHLLGEYETVGGDIL